jgi:hypothetical protein
MASIRANCPNCGQVDLRPEELSLRVEADHGRYGFTCPGCRTEVSGSADRRMVAVLIAAGVEAGSAERAPEAALPPEDRSPRPDAAAFTLDDVIDLHFLLDDDAWLEEELSQDREHELQR